MLSYQQGAGQVFLCFFFEKPVILLGYSGNILAKIIATFSGLTI